LGFCMNHFAHGPRYKTERVLSPLRKKSNVSGGSGRLFTSQTIPKLGRSHRSWRTPETPGCPLQPRPRPSCAGLPCGYFGDAEVRFGSCVEPGPGPWPLQGFQGCQEGRGERLCHQRKLPSSMSGSGTEGVPGIDERPRDGGQGNLSESDCRACDGEYDSDGNHGLG